MLSQGQNNKHHPATCLGMIETDPFTTRQQAKILITSITQIDWWGREDITPCLVMVSLPLLKCIDI